MPDDYKISDLSNVVEISNNDLMEISAVNSSSDTGYSSVKATMTQIAEKIANGVQYSADLETTSKTLVGAINEVNAGGGASSLDDLGDVDIDSPQDKQVLLYDDANDEWVNGDNVAKSLAESIKTTEETPYQYRQTPITANRTLEKLIGVSCAFNQLLNGLENSTTKDGLIITNNNDGSISISGTALASSTIQLSNDISVPRNNDVIFFNLIFSTALMGGNNVYFKGYGASYAMTNQGKFFKRNDGSNWTGAFILDYKQGTTIDVRIWFNVHNLTACFGSEVADYFYNLETQTAGAGVAKFRQLFPESYYAYQTATLMSAKPVAKKVVGKNLLDDTTYVSQAGITISKSGHTLTLTGTNAWAKMVFYPVLPNDITNLTLSFNLEGIVNAEHNVYWGFQVLKRDGTYRYAGNITKSIGSKIISVALASGEKISRIDFNINDSSSALSPSATVVISNIQVEFGSTATAYEPYEEHTYPLGSDEIRGLLKVENGQLVAYGDVKPSDGNGTEVFDIVDLGDCTWGGGSEVSGKNLFTVAISNFKRPIATTALPNAIVGEFDIKTQTDAPGFNNVYSGLSWFDGLAFWTSDYTAAQREQLKSDMSGVYLIYEKATPTAKSYTPFTNPMLCGSTEEFTDSRSLKMFCGHQSQYYTETEGDKLAALPEVTGERGRFVIESYGGKMSLSQIKDITGTLTAGNTSITLSDASITTESTIDVYTDTFGVNPTAVSVSAGAVTLTFAAQSSNVKVKVRIS